MKLSLLVASVAVAVGSGAMAQVRDTTRPATANTRATAPQSSEPGVVDKTRDSAKRMASGASRMAKRGAQAVRNTGENIARKLPPGPNQAARASDPADTRAMGAGPAAAPAQDRTDASRTARMDDAYANWKRQQDKR